MNVHVVGNSHVMYFAGRYVSEANKKIVVQKNGLTLNCFKAGETGATIFGLDNPRSTTKAGESIRDFLKKETVENVVIVLGDVDFREHIQKRMGKGFENVLDSIVSKLKAYVDLNVRPVTLGKIILFEMIPFSKEFFSTKPGLKDLQEPFLSGMRDAVGKVGIEVISIRDETQDEDGYLKREFLRKDDIIHLEPSLVHDLVVKKTIDILRCTA